MQKIPDEKSGWRRKNTAGACTKPAEKRHSGSPQIPELLKNSPPKKAAGRKIHSEKCEFSFRKVLRKVEKLWIRREKFPTLYEKSLKMIRKVRKKCPETGSGSRKNRLFLRKEFRKSTEKTGMGWKNFSALDKKISRWSEKISKTDDPDKRTTELFLPADNRKMQEKKQEETKKSIKPIRKRHEKHTADKDKSCHLRTVRSSETALSIGYSQGKK